MPLVDWQTLHQDAFAGVRCVVTGGAGFIGSHLAEALLILRADVVVIDDLSAGDEANLAGCSTRAPERFTFVKGSILDDHALTLMADATYVFHQAAMGSVPGSVADPVHYHNVNDVGTFKVLEAARQHGVKRVMFAASSSAYGDSETLPKIETMNPLPKSPYAANKVACEAMIRAYANCYETDAVALRYFNIFGPRQNANSAYAAVIAAFAQALLNDRQPTIFGDGEQSRDFTFVDNAVHANLLAARSAERLNGEVVNVAVGERVSVNQLAAEMANMLGKPKLTPTHQPERVGDVKHSLADLTLARKLLRYEPAVSFSDGLKATCDWYSAATR